MFHALSTVYREEGFRALYKGWLPSVIGVVSHLRIEFFIFFIWHIQIVRTMHVLFLLPLKQVLRKHQQKLNQLFSCYSNNTFEMINL